jgi:Tol biopolymer transport system component
VSPDGKWIVYERSPTWGDNESPVDLWIVKIDGSEERLLIKNGQSPSWSK